jgi:hypothetical protein
MVLPQKESRELRYRGTAKSRARRQGLLKKLPGGGAAVRVSKDVREQASTSAVAALSNTQPEKRLVSNASRPFEGGMVRDFPNDCQGINIRKLPRRGRLESFAPFLQRKCPLRPAPNGITRIHWPRFMWRIRFGRRRIETSPLAAVPSNSKFTRKGKSRCLSLRSRTFETSRW